MEAKFNIESIADISEEFLELFKKQAKERSFFKSKIDPDVFLIHRLEMQGSLKIYTIRAKGDLLGFAIYTINQSLHVKKELHAMLDSFYIPKKLKQISFIGEFISYCEADLESDGVKFIFQYSQMGSDYSKQLGKLGYKQHEEGYGKELKRKA